ncbi:HEPN domain-containing protein [Pedobacter montanisoli]|uniref:HEPN domain-containing protein n=1 Tax=Pedobacter montanisoli TaxID=2923277 RepID=A0ABS9ZZ94_9SPHI|nr:HEPN domain-containing protein [Pedobacter montanisoli]MCJ0743627.1 HEPN domain-containing protein [Pedobacter montanisoli]
METAILNPTTKQAHLAAFTTLIVDKFKPLQIYLYAHFVQQQACNSIFAAKGQLQQEIFYLLVITEGTASKENEIQDFANRHYPQAKLIINAHGKEILNRNLQQCNAYFTSILNQGTLLYSANGLMDKPKVQGPNSKKQANRANAHWQRRSEMARTFINAAVQAMENGQEKASVFLLYHACEQLCVAMIWVYMGYKTDIRNLKRLFYVCACFSEKPLQHFMGSPVTEALLHTMMKSYREARYNDDFSLAGQSPYRFLELTESFYDLAEELSIQRLAEMSKT